MKVFKIISEMKVKKKCSLSSKTRAKNNTDKNYTEDINA